jgi:SAM-dependent methyltransferase
MNSQEYAMLDQVDREHWFYQGKRAIVRHWVQRYLSLQAEDVWVDAGCGTGTLLVEMSAQCRVIGLDDHSESIARARPRVEAVGGRVLQTTLESIDLPAGCASVVTALDVLEHLDNPAAAARELIRLLRPGGLLVVTVPALRWLWSDWDVALHHRRRYVRRELLADVRQRGASLLHCAYFNAAVLPLIALIRLWRRWFPPRPGAPRAEDKVPGRWLNGLLYRILVKTACWGWFRPPVGVSLLAVLRREDVAIQDPFVACAAGTNS